jgi:hypothetical protein
MMIRILTYFYAVLPIFKTDQKIKMLAICGNSPDRVKGGNCAVKWQDGHPPFIDASIPEMWAYDRVAMGNFSMRLLHLAALIVPVLLGVSLAS